MASLDEAALAISAGADAIGLVSAMPSGPGPISEALIPQIARSIPPPIAAFLLTCQTEARRLIPQALASGCNTVQLVDHVPPDEWPELRNGLPSLRLVQVIHVTGEAAIAQAADAATRADAILLDSGNPRLAVKQLGGTGRPHDWTLSRRIVEQVQERLRVPVFLAGGLSPGNVAEAIRVVRPFGVDVCSGVRTEGRLDGGKLAMFADAVRKAI